MESSIRVPCCSQSLHVTCLARSFMTRGQSCPFCNRSLSDIARSASFQASSLFHGCMIDVDAPPTNRGINSLSLPSVLPRPPDRTTFLCCQRVGPPQLFEPTGDRRMEWSPFQNPGSSEWIPQWMCVPCSRVVGLPQTRDRPQVVCSQCQVICPTEVVDCSSDTQWMWCARCQRREEITSQDAPRSVFPNWFLQPTVHDGPSVWMGSVSHLSSRQRFSVMAFLSTHLTRRWLPPNVNVTFLCIPRDLGLPSRTCNVISGIRRQLRSFNCTMTISSL